MIPEPTEAMLPCPFCGGTAKVFGKQWTGSPFVECATCTVKKSGGTEAEAIAAWNTREPEAGKLREALLLARNALQAMMDTWLDYHDAHSLTQAVTGASANAFEIALAARDKIDALSRNQGR